MITHFHISQQGERNAQREKPCQDFSMSRRVQAAGREAVIVAIADGVGSCAYSHIGAQTAVEQAMRFLEQGVEQADRLDDEAAETLLRGAFDRALACVRARAHQLQYPFALMDSTLTCCIFDGRSLWFGHIGDDGIVALMDNGECRMITTRHCCEEAHTLYPLREKSLWEFGKAPANVISAVLLTDGMLDWCVCKGGECEGWVYYPFLQPVLTSSHMNNNEEAEAERREWEAYLADAQGLRTMMHDDITFCAVMNPEARAAMKTPPVFDEQQWRRQLNEAREKVENELKKAAHRQVEKHNRASQRKDDSEKSDPSVCGA